MSVLVCVVGRYAIVRVNDHPCASSQFSSWRNVDEHRLLVVAELVDNHGTILENLQSVREEVIHT